MVAEATGSKRSKETVYADLIGFLETVACYLPHSYITEKIINNTTSLNDVFRLIFELYGAELTSDSFLDLAAVKKLPAESHRQLFERMLDHVNKHLTKPNISVDNFTSGATGDSMTLTLLNVIVIMWLQKIDPRLIDAVKLEYATDLRAGTEL